jgi:hypothetical protein
MGEQRKERKEIETHDRVNPPQSVPDSDDVALEPANMPEIGEDDDEDEDGG